MLAALILPVWPTRNPAPDSSATAPAPAPRAAPAAPSAPAPQAAEHSTPEVDTEARRSSLDKLAEAQELRAKLEEAGVTDWAAEPFTSALAELERGTVAYRAQDYPTALLAYEAATAALAALRDQIEPRTRRLLEAGAAALTAGDAPGAQRAFAAVLAMVPGEPQAQAGLARVATLPRVQELTARGQALLDAGDAAGAATAFQAALALDAAATQAREGAQRARALGVKKRFDSALNEGFGHLQAGRLEPAASAFQRALKIAPDSREARDGLTEARGRARDAQVRELLAAARRAEATENWEQAVNRYRELLAVEANLAPARAGLSSAEARTQLDARLQATLADPQRLGSPDVQRAAQKLLDEAGAVANPGPRLQSQVQALRQALDTARIPVPVTLQSDGATQVTVLRVGALGKFSDHRLELRPGNYVAIGERVGYRDVRVRFEVHSGSPPPPVVVICRETI